MFTQYVDPEIAVALSNIPSLPTDLNEARLADWRLERLTSLNQVELSDRFEKKEHLVLGPPDAPDVLISVYTPLGLALPAGCMYWIHGGGYVVGETDMDIHRLDRLCSKTGVVGVTVDYRLAPETPYPGPLEDCYAGLQWIHAHAAQIGVDPSRIGVGGQSAGGGLAAALAILARDRGDVALAFQLLIYPMIDDRQMTPSSNWSTPIWPPANNAFGWRSYLGPLYGTSDLPGYAAPARAEDLRGLPPTLIYVGTMDGFCDEDINYAMRLNHSGVATELHVYPGVPHGFENLCPSAEVSRRCHRDTEEWLARTVVS